jgi:two-component system response regulator AtoC
MAEVRELIQRVADTDVTVLIRGESGTGKELVSRALYAASRRRDKPFVKVNCAALPTELLESELFGFERGAFTGAVQRKPGRFEFANHGTMFLDEVSEMSPPLQAKLLQVLQDGEFSRLGGKNDIHVDVRIVAATNRDLERSVFEGQFRKDLFFRLNVVSIQVPPLRERREEIPLLADHFGKKYSVQYNKPRLEMSPDTMALCMEYDWPGNVRELENLIKRTVILGSEEPIRREIAHALARHRAPVSTPAPARSNGRAAKALEEEAASPKARGALPAAEAFDDVSKFPDDPGSYSLKDIARTAARRAEREVIEKMLQRTRWNRKQTAGILGISYKALLYKIKENGLDKAV